MARLLERVDPERVRANLLEVRARIDRAARRSGRRGEDVELLAATKYVPCEQMGALTEAGISIVGENTARSLAEKEARWGDRFGYDFIGHLQSRKTKDVLGLVRLIHSVESESVLREIQKHGQAPPNVLLEVNVSHEQSKHGVLPEQIDPFMERASAYEMVRFCGLMTMPPATKDAERARPHFASLRELASRLARDWGPEHSFELLSMGTSQDYEVAVEEGATIVRLGMSLYI